MNMIKTIANVNALMVTVEKTLKMMLEDKNQTTSSCTFPITTSGSDAFKLELGINHPSPIAMGGYRGTDEKMELAPVVTVSLIRETYQTVPMVTLGQIPTHQPVSQSNLVPRIVLNSTTMRSVKENIPELMFMLVEGLMSAPVHVLAGQVLETSQGEDGTTVSAVSSNTGAILFSVYAIAGTKIPTDTLKRAIALSLVVNKEHENISFVNEWTHGDSGDKFRGGVI